MSFSLLAVTATLATEASTADEKLPNMLCHTDSMKVRITQFYTHAFCLTNLQSPRLNSNHNELQLPDVRRLEAHAVAECVS